MRIHRSRALGVGLGLTLTAAFLAAGPAAVADEASDTTDEQVVVVTDHLDSDEVADLDITDTDEGQDLIDDAIDEGVPADTEAYVVYQADETTLVVPAATEVVATEGLNAEGEQVTQLAPKVAPVEAPAQAGLAVPPKASWKYNTDGVWSKTVDDWVRQGIWTITWANNYKTSTTATPYDYFRLYYRVRGGLKNASDGSGYRRLWIELNRDSNGTSPTTFEFSSPEESYSAPNNVTTTIGFGTSNTFNLGYGPASAGGGTSTSYSGSISYSNENWHPVLRDEAGSGGVQYCKYGNEFRGTRLVTTRVGYRTGATTTPPGWTPLDGMSVSAARCPAAVGS